VIFISFRKPDRERENAISIWFLILMGLSFFSGNHSNLVSLLEILWCLKRNFFGKENAQANWAKRAGSLEQWQSIRHDSPNCLMRVITILWKGMTVGNESVRSERTVGVISLVEKPSLKRDFCVIAEPCHQKRSSIPMGTSPELSEQCIIFRMGTIRLRILPNSSTKIRDDCQSEGSWRSDCMIYTQTFSKEPSRAFFPAGTSRKICGIVNSQWLFHYAEIPIPKPIIPLTGQVMCGMCFP
jgi:hypothetical protein